MGLTLANLAGLWALLGIPAILLIHFLQKERRQIVTSTLFLLEDMQKESKSGIRLERLRNSLPLWLQILAVLLVTWMLTEPRWIRPDSFHRVVVVLDSSASMSPFRDEALSTLERQIASIARASAQQEWIVLESDRRRGTLYSGDDAAAMRRALSGWRPGAGTHDFTPALEEARALLRRDGSVIFVTNRAHQELPTGVYLLAVGAPLENFGFTGLRVEETPDGPIWHALARNYGSSTQTREWQAFFPDAGVVTSSQTLQLAPGQGVALSGRFPDGGHEGYLRMSGDRFALDNWLPLIRPQPKPLDLFVEQHPLLADFAEPFLRSLSHWNRTAPGQADLRFATRLSHQDRPVNPGIYFLVEPEAPRSLLTAPLVAENEPLVRELNWQGLLVQAEAPAPGLTDTDRVLLWQGDRPLLIVRQSGQRQWLFVNFDLRYSNASRSPAFVILLHRFVDQVRLEKRGFEQRNLQTGQTFSIAADPMGAPLTLRFVNPDNEITETSLDAHRAHRMTAPSEPGFLRVSQGNEALLHAAVHFADARQADFTEAVTETRGPSPEGTLLQRNTRADFLAPLWLLLLGGVLVYSWFLTGRREG